MPPKPPPPTQAQIEEAFTLYRVRLALLHEMAGKRDHLMKNRMSPSAIMDANASIAQHRITVTAAREALRDLLDHPGAPPMF